MQKSQLNIQLTLMLYLMWYQYGSDGIRSLTCIKWIVLLLPTHLASQHLSLVNELLDKSTYPSVLPQYAGHQSEFHYS